MQERHEDDNVNHPPHYNAGRFETIDLIEDAVENPESFLIGNAIKYLHRYRHKGSPLTDLLKARWYIDRAITRLKSAGANAWTTETTGP